MQIHVHIHANTQLKVSRSVLVTMLTSEVTPHNLIPKVSFQQKYFDSWGPHQRDWRVTFGAQQQYSIMPETSTHERAGCNYKDQIQAFNKAGCTFGSTDSDFQEKWSEHSRNNKASFPLGWFLFYFLPKLPVFCKSLPSVSVLRISMPSIYAEQSYSRALNCKWNHLIAESWKHGVFED